MSEVSTFEPRKWVGQLVSHLVVDLCETHTPRGPRGAEFLRATLTASPNTSPSDERHLPNGLLFSG